MVMESDGLQETGRSAPKELDPILERIAKEDDRIGFLQPVLGEFKDALARTPAWRFQRRSILKHSIDVYERAIERSSTARNGLHMDLFRAIMKTEEAKDGEAAQ